MPTAQPDAAIAAIIDATAGSLSSYAIGQNLFTGPVRPPSYTSAGTAVVPHAAIFCNAYDEQNSAGVTANLSERFVQVTVRGDVGASSAALAVARAVRDAVHRATSDGYAGIWVSNGPTFAPLDPTKHPEFRLNVRLAIVT